MPTPRSIIVYFYKIDLCSELVRVVVASWIETVAIIILFMVVKHNIYAVTVLSNGVRIVIITFLVSLLAFWDIGIAGNETSLIYICYYDVAEIISLFACGFVTATLWLLNV